MKKIILITTILTLLFASFILASDFEWISNPTLLPNDANCRFDITNKSYGIELFQTFDIDQDCIYRIGAIFHTDGNEYTENIAYYYKEVNDNQWTMLTRNQQDPNFGFDAKTTLEIDGNLWNSISVKTNMPAGSYVYRASMNFDGCVGWTPTPNTNNCGDVKEFYVNVN